MLLLEHKRPYVLTQSYLSERLVLIPNFDRKSDDKLVLMVPTNKTENKNHFFSTAGTNLWNQLSSHIRLYKSTDVFKKVSEYASYQNVLTF